LILLGGVVGLAAAAAAEKDAVVLVVGLGRLVGRLLALAPRPVLLRRTRPCSRRLPVREHDKVDMVGALCGGVWVVVFEW